MAKAYTADKRNKRVCRKAMLERARIYGDQMARTWHRLFKQREIAAAAGQNSAYWSEKQEREKIVNSMTNWQRNICLRACKGNLSRFSTETLRAYANTVHWKKNPEYCAGGDMRQARAANRP